MREHEVPTHVQAEDRVLLWLTFPQVVSLIAVAAVGYGVFNYAPGPTGLRIGLALVVGVIGGAAAVGQIGGRRLPLVAADLLKYWLGPRRFVGHAGDLLRPAPVMTVESDPGLLDKMLEKGRRRIRRLGNRRDRRNGDGPNGQSSSSNRGKGKGLRRSKKDKRTGRLPFGRRRWAAVGMMVLLTVAIVLPQAVAAQGEDDGGGHRFSEIDLELPPPVIGRRVYVESVTVSRDRLNATMRAATDIDLRVRAYGGDGGGALRSTGLASVDEGESASFNMPLDGDNPSFTFSWVDALGHAGALSLSTDHLPYPLPYADGVLCDAEVTSLTLSRTTVSGIASTVCEQQVMETLEVETVSGTETVEVQIVREAEVTHIAGRVSVGLGSQRVDVPLVVGGDTSFSLSVEPGVGAHDIFIEVDMRGALRVPMPPLIEMESVPERTVRQTHTVSVLRPGISRDVSETVSILCEDGTEERHRISVRLSIPATTIEKTTSVPVTYTPYVTAEIVDRNPAIRTRNEALEIAVSLWMDTPYVVLQIPEPEPTPEAAEQVRESSDVLENLFKRVGWKWPW